MAAPSASWSVKVLHLESYITFEACMLWEMESRVFPAQRVFSIATTWRAHLMEGSNSVANLELCDILSDCIHSTGDVIALVDLTFGSTILWTFPSVSLGQGLLGQATTHQSLGLLPE